MRWLLLGMMEQASTEEFFDLLSTSVLASTWPYPNGHTRYPKKRRRAGRGWLLYGYD